MRLGWLRPAHCKSLAAREMRPTTPKRLARRAWAADGYVLRADAVFIVPRKHSKAASTCLGSVRQVIFHGPAAHVRRT